jgi:hypothetical protein
VTLLAALPSEGFQYAVFVYLAAAFVSFVAAANILWRRRRQAGRHVPCALGLAVAVGLLQLLVVVSLGRLRSGTFDQTYFRDTMLATALVLLPAFFISSFVLTASGAFLSERARTPPFPVARGIASAAPSRWRPAGESLAIALVAGGVGLAWSVALFAACERITGKPPEPAPGTEEVAGVFAGNVPLVLGFGLAAAIWEEIFVRLFLLNALRLLFKRARGATAAAVAVSSAIWAAGHAGTMNPELVKFLQVFAIGIMLDVIYLKRGFETTLAAHGAFNIGILVVGGFQ